MAKYVLGLNPDQAVPAGSKVIFREQEIGIVASVCSDEVTIGDETIHWMQTIMDICDEITVRELETLWRLGNLTVAPRTGPNPALCFYVDELTS